MYILFKPLGWTESQHQLHSYIDTGDTHHCNQLLFDILQTDQTPIQNTQHKDACQALLCVLLQFSVLAHTK